MALKFSIGIPAFKSLYLEECIDSILQQSYDNFELIIVNDASPEDLDEIVSRYTDSRIKYFKNDVNFGAENVIDNWNKCLSFAKGEYFVLMGDDDKLDKDYLFEFDKLIRTYPELNVYHCRSLIINEKSQPITITQSWAEFESVIENMWHRTNGFRNQFISDFVFSTEFLNSNGGFYKNKLAWASDDITSYIAMKDKGIAHVNLPLLFYRRSSINISSSGSVRLKLQAIEQEFDWYDNFLDNFNTHSQVDTILLRYLRCNLSKFKKKKIVETIAYNGFKRESFIKDCCTWINARKKYSLSIKEVIYIAVLAYKKIKVLDIY
ncbi:glycosyltransferase family 2 protein [Klebsiella sp. MISC125]|uniref:glycosyltransferase family 2 protein n=1 Tax=Klebsiella sp. MISC125 TaxID=2755386 RepID=UPI003DA9C424